jgi:hypothetical protein
MPQNCLVQGQGAITSVGTVGPPSLSTERWDGSPQGSCWAQSNPANGINTNRSSEPADYIGRVEDDRPSPPPIRGRPLCML